MKKIAMLTILLAVGCCGGPQPQPIPVLTQPIPQTPPIQVYPPPGPRIVPIPPAAETLPPSQAAKTQLIT